jgi:hypothetical protein
MKHLILMNKKTGEISLGVRVHLFDEMDDKENFNYFDGYSVRQRAGNDYDAWLIFSSNHTANSPCTWLYREDVDGKNEIIGEL